MIFAMVTLPVTHMCIILFWYLVQQSKIDRILLILLMSDIHSARAEEL